MHVYKKLLLGISIFLSNVIVCNEARKLNILFVVSYFPAPSQTFILNMMTGLRIRGHNVTVFSFHKGDTSYMHPHINEYSLMDHTIYEDFPLDLSEYDIIFCQFGYLGKKIFEIEGIQKQLKDKKIVVCFRGSDLTAHVKEEPNMYKKLLQRGDLFLPVCSYFKKKLIALKCDPTKIIVHHSAINCSQFFFSKREKPEKGPIDLISVCRLVEKKGIDIAIKAVAKVVKKYKNIHYTIVGEGPERSYLKKLIKKLKLGKNVTLTGWLSQDEVVEILNKSHIFVLSSIISPDGNEEGIANALKEAMAMGLITIATNHAGNPELIDDRISGFLVQEGNYVRLAQIIEYVIEHPEVWGPIQIAARKKVERFFETRKCVEKLERIFYQLLG